MTSRASDGETAAGDRSQPQSSGLTEADTPRPSEPQLSPPGGAQAAVARLRGWPWLIALVFSTTTGIAALLWISHVPPIPNCEAGIGAATSSAQQLYCADQQARQGKTEAILAALDLIRDWSPDHPLYTQAQKLADDWSQALLALARRHLDQGQLQEAVKLAEQVPPNSSIYPEAQNLMSRWRNNWEQGKEIYARVQTALKKQNWNQASEELKFLVQLGGDYWPRQAQQLVEQLAVERQAGNQLLQAREEAASETLEGFVEAIAVASRIDAKTYIYREAQNSIETWSQKLLVIAQERLGQGDLSAAIAAAQSIPPGISAALKAQELLLLGQARTYASQDQLWSYLLALALVEQIPRDSSLTAQVQPQRQTWTQQVQNLGQLQLANVFASVGQVFAYELAIEHAALVGSEQPRRRQAQTLIASWHNQIEIYEDRQYLAQAKGFATRENLEQLRAAIALARRVAPGRALRREAQTLIFGWNRRIEEIEDQPILDQARALAQQGELEAAIERGLAIAPGRALYAQAQADISNWVAEIQIAEDQPILERARSQASQGRLTDAIATASLISSDRALYPQAQAAVESWLAELRAIAAAREAAQSPAPTSEAETEAEALPPEVPEAAFPPDDSRDAAPVETSPAPDPGDFSSPLGTPSP